MAFTPKTWVNSPSTSTPLDAAGMIDLETRLSTDYEYAYSTYKSLARSVGVSNPASSASTFVLAGMQSGGALLQPNNSACGSERAFYLDPADFAVSGRTTKLRMRATCFQNAVAMATTATVSLQQVLSWGGIGSNVPIIATLNGAITNSTVAFASPGPAATSGVSAEFTFPSAAWYCFCVTYSGTAAVASVQTFSAELELRQV